MRKTGHTTLAIVAAALVLLVFLNRYALDDRLSGWISASQVPWAGTLFEKLSVLGDLAQAVGNYRTVALDTDALARERERRVHLEALLRAVQEENELLQRSLGIQERLSRPVVPARVFSSLRTPLGHTLMVDRGSAQGITAGDIVATVSGVLVGQVSTVFSDTAAVRLLTDPGFEVTAKIAGTETTGLARGTGGETISLEFIVQADQVHENDAVVTSGDDRFPPALVIGSVERVQAGQSQLFKDVSVRPTVHDFRFGPVAIIPLQ